MRPSDILVDSDGKKEATPPRSPRTYMYMYVCMCVCVYIYIHIYIYCDVLMAALFVSLSLTHTALRFADDNLAKLVEQNEKAWDNRFGGYDFRGYDGMKPGGGG